MVKLPGRTAAAPPAAPPPPVAQEPATPEAPAAAPPMAAADEARAQVVAQIRREMAVSGSPAGGRALVALADRTQAGAISGPLGRHGYQVDTLDNPDEGARLLEQ